MLEIKQYFVSSHARCHKPMVQLIERYRLQNKTVLSVGAAFGHQEYCFHEYGCSLTLCDIDEGHTIEPYLKTLKEGDLTFALGDARDLDAGKFDVVFFSGFTPNELENRHKSKIRRFIGRQAWHDRPFIDVVIGIVDRSLAKGGFLIYQSYGSHVDARRPEYIQAVKKQLQSLDIKLVDVYYYESHPHVHLIVGLRADNVPEFSHEITAFHGRGQQTGKAIRSSYLFMQTL